MTASTDDFLGGVPVPVDPIEIERELAALWKPASSEKGGEGAVVRACLANLICFLPDPRDRAPADELLLRVSQEHPNRTILLCSNPQGWPAGEGCEGSGRLRAFVTAVCSAPVRGCAPICCERITLEARPPEVSLFSGAVAPLVVPDIPVFLLWAGNHGGGDSLLAELAANVDRVIVSTRRDVLGSGTIEELQPLLSRPRIREIVDLGWRGLDRWRRALADLFDDAKLRSALPDISDVTVQWAAPDGSSPGRGAIDESALLAGWIVSRLGLTFQAREERGPELRLLYHREDGRPLDVRLGPLPEPLPPGLLGGEPAALGIGIRSGEDRAELSLRIHPDDPGTVEVSYRNRHDVHLSGARSFVRPDNAELLLGILNSPTHPCVFREALEAALRIVGASP